MGVPPLHPPGILCSMASFKAYCALTFWKGKDVMGPEATSDDAMGQFGRLTSAKDIPSRKVLTGRRARALRTSLLLGPEFLLGSAFLLGPTVLFGPALLSGAALRLSAGTVAA